MHLGAPECTRISLDGKTKPPGRAGEPALSLAQHAAIRYLVRGYPLGKIARHLGVSRHTVTRWKHLPHFAAEIERLRLEMTAAIISPAAKATPPPHPIDPLATYLKAINPR
jgi:transposase-like protein